MTSTARDPGEDRPVDRLEAYLCERLRDGPFYFKSNEIASEVSMSPSEVGQYLRQLEDDASFALERWGYTGGTRWRVSEADASRGRNP